MNMSPGSWRIYAVDNVNPRIAYVTADMLEFGRTWPTRIKDAKTGVEFAFVCNEVMQDWMVGNYSGHAKYVEICEETTQSAESNK